MRRLNFYLYGPRPSLVIRTLRRTDLLSSSSLTPYSVRASLWPDFYELKVFTILAMPNVTNVKRTRNVHVCIYVFPRLPYVHIKAMGFRYFDRDTDLMAANCLEIYRVGVFFFRCGFQLGDEVIPIPWGWCTQAQAQRAFSRCPSGNLVRHCEMAHKCGRGVRSRLFLFIMLHRRYLPR